VNAALAAAAWLLALGAPDQAPALRDDGWPAPPRAAVTLVGAESAARPVREALEGLLGRESIAVAWARLARLAPEDVLEARAAAPAERAISVFVDLSSPVEARIWFRDPSGQRFVLRRLALARESGALGVEEIAQVVKSGVLALGAGTAASLSLSQARAALEATAGPPSVAAAPVLRALPARDRRLDVEIGAAGVAQAFAPGVPVSGRADVSLAVASRSRIGGGGGWGAWLAFGYGLPVRFRDEPVGADIRTLALRAGAIWEPWRRGAVTVRVAVGGGVDRVAYEPQADAPGATVAPAGRFLTPVGCAAVGVRVALGSRLALAVAAVGDVATGRDHYDTTATNGELTRALVPYLFRPGASLGLDWRI
jgi:hypothetical protein